MLLNKIKSMVKEIIENIINQYFIQPILTNTGYNLVNTLVFAIIAIVISFGFLYPFLNKKGVKFNSKFILSLIPFILIGIGLRVLEDQKILQRCVNPLEYCFYTYTPGIWILVAAITIFSLLIAFFLAKKLNKDFHLIFALIGSIIALPIILFDLSLFKENFGFLGVIGTAIVTSILVIYLFKFLKPVLGIDVYSSSLNKIALIAQTLDGSATFIALQFFKCGEQHVVSNLIIQLFSPVSFLIIKVLFVTIFLWALDDYLKKESSKSTQEKAKPQITFIGKSGFGFIGAYLNQYEVNENLIGFIKMFIIIIGLAPGLRDLFTLAIGTCS